MKLYYNPMSSYSQKAMIAFNEKGIEYEPELVDLMSPEAREAYEKIHPLGKVPLFKPSDDWSVPESTTIIEYLDDKFPDTPRMIPAGGGDAARQVRLMDRMADLYLNDPTRELMFQKHGFKPENEAQRANRYIQGMYEHFDKRLANQEWVCGTFSMADCATIPPLFYAQMIAPFNDRPNLQRYWERAQKRPSYAKVMKEFLPIWEGFTVRTAAQ